MNSLSDYIYTLFYGLQLLWQHFCHV